MQVFKGAYSLPFFFKDLFAGITVGIVSVPLALAFAIACGARPEQGLYTALIAGGVVALLGGSRFQVAGPTGAFVLLISTTMQKFGYDGLVLATLFAGALLVIMGIARFGALLKFIPYPVIIGFTSGLALFLFLNQLPDFLGLKIASLPKEFLERCIVLGKEAVHTNPWALALSLVTIAIMVLWPRYVKKFPGSLVAILVTVLLTMLFKLPVETIQERFGAISASLPPFRFPHFEWNLFLEVIPSAIAIALLAGIESLLSAIVADGMTGTRHNSNSELFGQGVGNILSVLFYGIPSTGAVARTATNIKNGAQTPVSVLVSTGFLLLILLLLGKYVALIPMATLAGILAVVAYNMSEWRHFKHLLSSPKRDIAVLLTTFLLTVFTDLITAIEVGIILATFLFADNASRSSKITLIQDRPPEEDDHHDMRTHLDKKEIPADVEVFEVLGPLFFAAAETFKTTLSELKCSPAVLIIRLRFVPSIDASGIRALSDIFEKTKREKTVLLLSGVSKSMRRILERSGFLHQIGHENVLSHIDLALSRAKEISSQKETETKPVPAAIPQTDS